MAKTTLTFPRTWSVTADVSFVTKKLHTLSKKEMSPEVRINSQRREESADASCGSFSAGYSTSAAYAPSGVSCG